MAIVIPKEHAQHFERWSINSFDKPPSTRTRPPSPAPAVTPPKPAKVATEQKNVAMEVSEEDVPSESPNVPFKLPTAEEIEQIHEEARKEGYQAGLEEGKKAAHDEGIQEIKTQVERLSGITDSLSAALNDLDQELAEDVLAFAVEVARQVVSSSLRVQPESLLPVIREAMATLPLHHGTVMIHLNPQDIEIVKSHFGEQILHAGWRIIEDKEIQPGGCRLHAGSSEVDATTASRWRRTLEAMGAKPDWLEPSP
ncbi:MAG: flagellar assembly protein [Pseudomonadota bacterium]|jgi:flagellar assembly protein FliH